MRNPMKPKNKGRRFTELTEDRGFTSAQFETPETPIPWKAIALAIGLFIVGGILLAVGILIKLGYLASEDLVARGTPFIVLGSIMFIPGAYHLYIAYYAYYKYPGYDFSLIPDWD
ncbi:hypothetical protein BDF20DRAFT_855630 [Mycotypha africana]|uniref:uncharacterized protein n=1 Tax=Mycotypha africana TaxID=64632 RepID=UPI002300BCB6|nr:uncharacterized protein BDF20DRAFT_855630 [Mycotypha africana]KAI8988425.1 hypothetical protein BDF20DRAFT_855630 [Mycotypha africana]